MPNHAQELFEIDLAELEKVAIQLDKGDEQRRDFKGIYAECAAVLRQVRLLHHEPVALSVIKTYICKSGVGMLRAAVAMTERC